MISLQNLLVSLITALFTGIVVAYITNILQRRRDELSFIRMKAEEICIKMNRLSLDYHMMIQDFNHAIDKDDVEIVKDQIYGSHKHLAIIENWENIQVLTKFHFPECPSELASLDITCQRITNFVRSDVETFFSIRENPSRNASKSHMDTSKNLLRALLSH
jgi:hypothetical protein